ncbi:MAG: rod shape-determining protein [Selenomonadaceae bacterium]|nr:rod shape-determining protein [Selenomonadaceae bacterium]
MPDRFLPMLPKLNEAAAVDLSQPSVWLRKDHDFLNSLIKSLAVSNSITDVGNIDSIPDVWARPLLFKMALFDSQKTSAQEFVKGLHDYVLGEWRCILAMIALKNIKRLDLKAIPINLIEDNSDIAQVLKALAPKESINGDENSWINDVYVIFYQNRPIAMTSPTTLVSAAADYSRLFNGTLPQPWSRDGRTLTDPIDYLTSDDLAALRFWINKLQNDILDKTRSAQWQNTEICNSLLTCLQEYRNDIERKNLQLNTNFDSINSELNLTKGIARLLNQTVKGREATAEDSAVRLIISSARKQRNILLVSPDMVRDFAEQEGIPATQLLIWLGLSANDINEQALSEGRNKIGRISLTGTEYRRPEEFFTDRMAVIDPGNAITGSLPIPGAQMLAEIDLSAILPIKRELLDYFTPEEITRRIHIEDTAEEIRVHFLFPLSGINGQQTDYKYTKSYPKRDLIYIETNVPIVEIWPNIKRDGWNKYYLYYENTEAQNQNSTEVGKDFFYVYPWNYGKDVSSTVPKQGLSNRYTARLNNFPEALICTDNESRGAFVQPVEVGVILLKQPESVNRETELTWQMGVDFGTSSTMIYYREGSKTPTPLTFEPHLFQVTNSGVDRNSTFINFIPSLMPKQRDGSFLSIFHLLNTENLHDEIRPLIDGHVFSLTTNNTEIFVDFASRIDSNLKWKDDDIGRRKVAAYVQQICIQSVAEAALRGVDKLKWNFSFPTAFSKEQKLAFQATCQEAINEAYKDTCYEGAQDIIESWPESKASAYHFKKYNGTHFSDGAICLDIGAGTTDISIISGQPAKIVYHTSIQFAGRYLFMPIYRHYELFASKNLNLSDVDDEQRQAIIDADMRENSEEYLKNLSFIAGREEVKNVLQQSQLAMAGIFYYLGNILYELHQKDVYSESNVPDIYVGGNGSRIFKWLTGGVSQITNNPFMEVLKRMIAESSGLSDSDFNIYLSHNPKVEVASGMIEIKPTNDSEFYDERRQILSIFGKGADSYIANSVIAGEVYKVMGDEHGKGTFISAYDISNGLNVDKLPTFAEFLDIFNSDQNIWNEGIDIDNSQQRDIQKRVNGYYVQSKGKELKKVFVEPVFIIAMKILMEMLNRDE